MIASSGPMVEIYKTVSLVAPKETTVLIEGETGTGKELLARMLHRYSRRSDQPFLAVDCGAIAPTLIESELFGAVRGAYTGSDRDRVGVFEAANHGTVLLDEIGEVDQAFQLKLLRFLQEREIRQVGSPRSKQIDVRVVAATNRDLHRLVQDGKFREDLWYRLAVIRIKMPPLRERHGDVPLLAQHFVERSNQRFDTSARLTESGLKTLNEYTWPGNIRQLQHLIERLCILSSGARIDEFAVREAIASLEPENASNETLADTEAEQIRKVLSGRRREISHERRRFWASNAKLCTGNSREWASIERWVELGNRLKISLAFFLDPVQNRGEAWEGGTNPCSIASTTK